MREEWLQRWQDLPPGVQDAVVSLAVLLGGLGLLFVGLMAWGIWVTSQIP